VIIVCTLHRHPFCQNWDRYDDRVRLLIDWTTVLPFILNISKYTFIYYSYQYFHTESGFIHHQAARAFPLGTNLMTGAMNHHLSKFHRCWWSSTILPPTPTNTPKIRPLAVNDARSHPNVSDDESPDKERTIPVDSSSFGQRCCDSTCPKCVAGAAVVG
jgi:hypothetical protein